MLQVTEKKKSPQSLSFEVMQPICEYYFAFLSNRTTDLTACHFPGLGSAALLLSSPLLLERCSRQQEGWEVGKAPVSSWT